MIYELAIETVNRITQPLIRSREMPITGVAVGWQGEGPLAQAGHDEFCLVAYVPKLNSSYRERAVEFCMHLADNAHIALRREEIKAVEVGEVRSLAFSGSEHGDSASINTRKWFKSLRPGIGIWNPTPEDSAAPYDLGAGTAGFFLKDSNDNQYLVSCNHVIARCRIEDDTRRVANEVIIQPASLDLSGHDLDYSRWDLTDLQRRFGVAELSAYVPVLTSDPSRNQPPVNSVDVAMALVTATDRDLELARLPYGGKILGQASVDAAGNVLGSGFVYKVGRTTGYTEGTIMDVNAVLPDVNFGGGVKATFVGQIAIKRTPDNSTAMFVDEGDSGSALLTDSHELAGLIFAIGTSNRTFANPIREVLTELSKVSGLSLSIVA